jgi:hypothetical protein
VPWSIAVGKWRESSCFQLAEKICTGITHRLSLFTVSSFLADRIIYKTDTTSSTVFRIREEVYVHKICAVLICITALSAFGQAPSSKYQPGTIMAVTAHLNAEKEAEGDVTRYDVSVKIGNVLYMVLYTPPRGSNSVEYSTGMQMLFSVGDRTLTFNSRLSGTTEVPILRQTTLPSKRSLDWSKAPGQYFSMKQQHISEALGLTADQQANIKPILEQETGEVGQILQNPVLSRKDKLNKYEKMVEISDAKIKPFLSTTQLNKLLDLRKEQRKELKRLIAEQNADNPN